MIKMAIVQFGLLDGNLSSIVEQGAKSHRNNEIMLLILKLEKVGLQRNIC